MAILIRDTGNLLCKNKHFICRNAEPIFSASTLVIDKV